MFDIYTTTYYCLLLICFIWVISYVVVVYDFIAVIGGAIRPRKVWRHIFETTILLGAAFAWLGFGDDWSLKYLVWRPAVPISGGIVLLAYLYSTYRKRVIALWLEVMVQLCLLFGIVVIMGFTLSAKVDAKWFFFGWFIFGIPISFLFIIAIVASYQRLHNPAWPTEKLRTE